MCKDSKKVKKTKRKLKFLYDYFEKLFNGDGHLSYLFSWWLFYGQMKPSVGQYFLRE